MTTTTAQPFALADTWTGQAAKRKAQAYEMGRWEGQGAVAYAESEVLRRCAEELRAAPLTVRAPEVAGLLAKFSADEIRCLINTAAEMAGAGHEYDDLSQRQIELSERAWNTYGL